MENRFFPVILLFMASSLLILPVYAQTGDELFEIGNKYFDNSSYVEAMNNWFKAAEVDPELSAKAWYNTGLAYAQMEDYQKAIIAWDKTLELAPGTAIAYSNKGTALRILGRYDEAAEAYNMALKLQPDNAKFKSDVDLVKVTIKKEKSPLSPVGILFALFMVVFIINRTRRKS